MGMIGFSEESLLGYVGSSYATIGAYLPTHVGRSCLRCGRVDVLHLGRSFGDVAACKHVRGFTGMCDCGCCGPFSETCVGAVSGWNEMIREAKKNGS
jgi:hypothetical protein